MWPCISYMTFCGTFPHLLAKHVKQFLIPLITHGEVMTILKKYSEQLNERQTEAVAALTGPLLILAGAGSGKTRVLTFRIANLIAQGECTADQILAVTFTNKAAREMENRIVKLLTDLGIPVFERMWVSTFHSICAANFARGHSPAGLSAVLCHLRRRRPNVVDQEGS